MIDSENYTDKISKPLALSIGLVMVVFLGMTDYLTGRDLSFSIFYLIPISFVTLISGKSTGLIISSISAAVWFGADIMTGYRYSHWLVPYWNSAVRLGYFIVHTFLLSTFITLIKRERKLSQLDPLTNAVNWRYFQEYAWRELERARRLKQAVTLAYIDLDNFKTINDTFGHDVGDSILRTLVMIVNGDMRQSDILARMGGDEFAILILDTDYEGANRVLNRVKDNINRSMDENKWPITVSIGAITYNVLPTSVKIMVKRADELMYSVKRAGKNSLKHEQLNK